MHDDARAIVEKAMAVEWDERLLRAYRAAAATEGSPALLAQIERCEECGTASIRPIPNWS
jgi:HemY protein